MLLDPHTPVSGTDTYRLTKNLSPEEAASLGSRLEAIYQALEGTEAEARYEPGMETEVFKGQGESERLAHETEEMLEGLEEVEEDNAIYLTYHSTASHQALREARAQAEDLEGIAEVIPDSDLH